jgi:hypothetical protein
MNNDLVIIELGRPRVLKFSHTALKTLVDLTGKELEDIDGELTPGNFDLIERLVYCGLLKDAKENNETITPDKVVELLDDAPSYVYVLDKVFAAWKLAFGVQDQGNQSEPVKEPAQGSRSTGRKT